MYIVLIVQWPVFSSMTLSLVVAPREDETNEIKNAQRTKINEWMRSKLANVCIQASLSLSILYEWSAMPSHICNSDGNITLIFQCIHAYNLFYVQLKSSVWVVVEWLTGIKFDVNDVIDSIQDEFQLHTFDFNENYFGWVSRWWRWASVQHMRESGGGAVCCVNVSQSIHQYTITRLSQPCPEGHIRRQPHTRIALNHNKTALLSTKFQKSQ